MEGSSHSYQRALHCLADLRTRREEIRAHWFLPYFMTAAFKISSSVFFHTPPFIIILIFARLLCCFSYYYCFFAFWVSNPQNPPPQINKLAATKPSALALFLSPLLCVSVQERSFIYFCCAVKTKRAVCVCVSF